MKNAVFLVVAIAVFLSGATLATYAALPLLHWAKEEWQMGLAIAWLIACVVVCGMGSLKVMGWYHRASVGRSQKD